MSMISIRCRRCGSGHTITVPFEAYIAWKRGEKIQDAMPMLTSAERELLKTQICDACWQSE